MEEKKKALGGLDVFLGIVCAILFADVIISNTSMGPSVIIWWIIIGLFFFIPNGLITAELTGAYPDKGGIYGWVNKAFGPRWAARLSWLYFINCALWMPSGFIWFSGALCDAFFPGATYSVQVIISIVITWVCIGIAILPMTESKWIINLGGISKILIFLMVTICGVFSVINGNPAANEMTWQTMKPTFDGGLMYLPVIVYCCCGMEILATNAHEMRNPRKDLPRYVIMVVIITIIANICASWSVLQVAPIADLDLVTGIGTVARMAFNSQAIFNVVMITLLFSVAVQMITWAVGGARGAAEAGISGELPAVFGKETKKGGMPIGGLVISGLISTVVIILYGFMAESASDLFWTLLAFSSILFFMPYAIMFPAFNKLRKMDPDAERPFRAPAGRFLAILCEVILFAVMVLFVWVPGQPFDAAYAVPIIVGLAVVLAIGEIIVARQLKMIENNVAEEE